MESFFGNSPEIQVAFIAGYLSYRLASAGLDRAHKTIDVIFQTLTYGLIAHVLYIALGHMNFDWWTQTKSEFLIIVLSAALTLIIAVFWRAKGRAAFASMLQRKFLTKENFAPSTWDSITSASHGWAYIWVTCDDGKSYGSDLSYLPKNLPHGPLVVDQNNNIAIYVTDIDGPRGGAAERLDNPKDEMGRSQMTYFPASTIKRVEISFKG